MIYPNNFETKIGFNQIRGMLEHLCLSSLGKEKVEKMSFSSDAIQINEWLKQIRDFRLMMSEHDDFPMNYFIDVREAVMRVRPENTHLEEEETFDLMRSLDTIAKIVDFLKKTEYQSLINLTEGIITFPNITRRINVMLDKEGKVKDGASFTLADIRDELKKTNAKVATTLTSILFRAKMDGLVDSNASPTMRDGRLMIPVAPSAKKKIQGIVHDESATGKTVFIEPAEVVAVNNRIRELESEERREVVRILSEFTKEIRPLINDICDSYRLLADIDFIQAKVAMADDIQGWEPEVSPTPLIDWVQAQHPILKKSLEKQGKKIVPLDICIGYGKSTERILLISGPNAGGKSICLKTAGLLQYMLQCGLSIPVRENSHTGVFNELMIDIGDEQSLENDLSTYSSHLINMKTMMKSCTDRSLLLIDEFGGGTEPQIGGAMAESFLQHFLQKNTWAVITTHYQNLKLFADENEGIVNAAMLYDRNQMRPLFQLSIGNPGSSFAIEIARNIGVPEDVIREASDKVGQDYVQSDKYLQDIIRDKRYWENKRQNIHRQEKEMEKIVAEYEEKISKLKAERREIINSAKDEASRLLKESNARIESTIKEIKEKKARKEETKAARRKLNEYKEQIDTLEVFDKPKKTYRLDKPNKQEVTVPETPTNFAKGDYVRMKGQNTIGRIESINGKNTVCVFGDLKTRVKVSQLEKAEKPKEKIVPSGFVSMSQEARDELDRKKTHFSPDLDIRGMRGEEAINTVLHFIDDAIMVSMPTVRILHGKGDGILRNLVRQYLATVPNVKKFRDESVQFGGSGITVVDL